MRTSIDQMLDVAKAFSSSIEIDKGYNAKYSVSIRDVWAKESARSTIISSIWATGDTVEIACENFLNLAKGKILVTNNSARYGENPIEFICL